jgi:GH25 family lysozyme M1 (1,4-beta-N-acetylmuramidase)
MKLFGPDVSHFQSQVDWHQVAAHGESFGACKATDGMTYVDPRFAENWSAMKKSGIVMRIAYHYAHTESSPRKQADHFVSTVGAVGAGDVLCLDAEDVCDASKKLSAQATTEWVTTFLERLMKVSGLGHERVLVYTGKWWWDPRTGRSTVGAAFPLWVADYTNDPPHLPAGWSTYALHQFTDKDRVPGVPTHVDRSSFNGTKDDLHRLAGLNASPAPDHAASAGNAHINAKRPALDRLTFHARNEDVKILQARLVQRGFPVEVTGFYGDHTKAAVAAFQRSRPELDGDADGLMGPITLRLLFS